MRTHCLHDRRWHSSYRAVSVITEEEEEYDMHVHDSEGSASVEIVVPAESKFGNKYLSVRDPYSIPPLEL